MLLGIIGAFVGGSLLTLLQTGTLQLTAASLSIPGLIVAIIGTRNKPTATGNNAMEQIWQTLIETWSFVTQRLTPSVLTGPITDPVPVFLVIIAIMLVAPLLFERFKLPGIVGLILAGVIVGPNGLGLLERDGTIVLLGTIGLLFLMFMAGLETSLDDLKYNANKAAVFGIATFVVLMVLGTAAMLLLNYSLLAAILVASCFASHTLLALPVVSKLGIMRSQAVTVTLGGTLITNILALLVLAIVVKAHQGNLTLGFWLFLIPSLSLYTFATLWGVPKVGRWFFRQFGHDEGAEFTFVVASLFIPFFLISVGMLVNPSVLLQEPRSLLVSYSSGQ